MITERKKRSLINSADVVMGKLIALGNKCGAEGIDFGMSLQEATRSISKLQKKIEEVKTKP